MQLYTSLFISLISLSSQPYFPFSYLLSSSPLISHNSSFILSISFSLVFMNAPFFLSISFFCPVFCFALVPLPVPPSRAHQFLSRHNLFRHSLSPVFYYLSDYLSPTSASTLSASLLPALVESHVLI